MAYYYRGLLYLRAGDYQNARAAFLQADYQDTVAEKEEFGGDFAVMPYLAVWSSRCEGDTARAQDLYQRAVEKSPQLAALGIDHAFLGLVDTGTGPVKVGQGKHKEIMAFEEPPNSSDQIVGTLEPTLVVASATSGPLAREGAALSQTRFGPFVRAGDLVYQATTRGGRPIQGILDGKAKFKDDTNAAGDAAVEVGTHAMMAGAYSNNSGIAGFGAIVGLLGMVAKAASSATCRATSISLAAAPFPPKAHH